MNFHLSKIYTGKLDQEITTKDLDTNPMKDLTIHRVLGVGCFGFVFAVSKYPSSGQEAHKLFQASSPSGCPLQEFEREGQLTDAQHPNVVRTHTIEVIPQGQNILELYIKSLETPYKFGSNVSDMIYYRFKARTKTERYPSIRVTMELCGPTLKNWLQFVEANCSLPEKCDKNFEFRREIGQGIIEGLKYLHNGKNIIHRDLKPDNIFFSLTTNDDCYQLPVKIGDFGLCRPVEDDISSSKTAEVGSLLYRAPDVGMDNEEKAKYSYRADLYSLGLILSELFQFIPQALRATHFDELVLARDESLVLENSRFPKLKETIISLTKKRSRDRIKSINLVDPFNMNFDTNE